MSSSPPDPISACESSTTGAATRHTRVGAGWGTWKSAPRLSAGSSLCIQIATAAPSWSGAFRWGIEVAGCERIVVGVDGSEQSQLVLRWAHREAALRDGSLEVVHVSSASRLLADAAHLDMLVQEIVGEDDAVPVQLHL